MQTSTHAQTPGQTSRMVLPLDRGKVLPELSGGKGASLSSMATAGLPVPDGFIVTTAAYRQVVAVNGLQAAIDDATRDLTETDPAASEHASERIRPLFEQAP